ncbi:GNAT family N-acetyltransferase [Dolosicoccus paucivorans]
MSESIIYRPMELTDSSNVLDLLWIIFEDMELPLLQQYPKDQLKELLEQAMTHSTFRYYKDHGIVAEQRGQVVGVIFVYPGKKESLIDEALNKLLDEQLGRGVRMFTDLETSPETYYIDSLVVYPKAQQQGIAKELIQQAKQKAIQEGFNRLDLNCDVENTNAKTRYENWGFKTRKQRYISEHLYDEMTYYFDSTTDKEGRD